MTSGTLLFNLAGEDFRRRKWLFFLWSYFCLMQLAICCLMGILYDFSLKGFISGAWSMPASAVVGFGVLIFFCIYGNVYDTDFPYEDSVESAAVSIRGLNMARSDMAEGYESIRLGRLTDMVLTGDDLAGIYQWLSGLARSGSVERSFAEVTVLFRMKDGQKRYRIYGIESPGQLFGLEAVYCGSAYKKGVGELPYLSSLKSRNAVWYNGIDSFCLDLTQEEKESLLACIETDNQKIHMEELSVRIPLGEVSWSFGTEPGGADSYIYEDFSETLEFLKDKGVGDYLKIASGRILETDKTVVDGEGDILAPEEKQQDNYSSEELISKELDRNPLLMQVEKNTTYLLKVQGPAGQTFLEGEFYRVKEKKSPPAGAELYRKTMKLRGIDFAA